MNKKTIQTTVVILIAVAVLTSTFLSGVIFGQNLWHKGSQAAAYVLPDMNQVRAMFRVITTSFSNITGIIGPDINRGSTPPNLEKLFKPFWEAWDIVHEQYIDQPVDDEALLHGAIRGMMDALGDQHTSYMDPDQYKQMNIAMEGEYEGIGAWVDSTAEYLTIISPMPNSPAEKAQLQSGDEIIKIDGKDMTGIDGNLVIKQVMGPAGSKVILTIRREGKADLFDVTVIRERVIVPSVQARILDNDIAYVQLFTFGENTDSDLRKELKKLIEKKPKGLILDLRNNGGGFLNTAIDVASEFIKSGVILYEDYGQGKRETFTSNGNGLVTDIPMVVLINEGTASASEIVAGAIQDHKRGLLVGTTSFGKGSVQNWIPLSSNQGAVRVTIARWLTPNQNQIHKKGLTPDIEVEMTEEDYKAKKDPQLDSAVKALLSKEETASPTATPGK